MAIQLRESVTESAAPEATLHAVEQLRPQGEIVVRIRNYGRAFQGRTVLSNVDLDLHEGEITALLGASGSGKSTLLRALAGEDPGADGHITVPRNRAVAFQDHRLLPWKRVWRNVLIGLPRGAGRADATRALDEVGIAGRADAWPGTLSGGESQRVALARAFIRQPRLLLLDEPFGALDALTRLRMHSLLLQLCERHQPATLLVTHDVDEAITLADRILVVRDGHISLDHRSSSEERSGSGALVLRTRLLGELGVYAPEVPNET
jgi:sulfonate transport system ATP-binding protein